MLQHKYLHVEPVLAFRALHPINFTSSFAFSKWGGVLFCTCSICSHLYLLRAHNINIIIVVRL